MNTDKGLWLEHAHLYIMAATLMIAIIGWSLYLMPAPSKSSRDVFCYMPTGVQPSLAVEQDGSPALDVKSRLA